MSIEHGISIGGTQRPGAHDVSTGNIKQCLEMLAEFIFCNCSKGSGLEFLYRKGGGQFVQTVWPSWHHLL